MSQQIRQIVDRAEKDLWKDGRVEVIDELFAPDFVWHTPPPGYGNDRSGYMQFVRDSTDAFETLSVTRGADLLIDGDRCAYLWRTRVRHVGPLLGFEPTHREAEYSGLSLIRVRDGKIVEEWDFPDTLTLMLQLGLMPQMETAGARR